MLAFEAEVPASVRPSSVRPTANDVVDQIGVVGVGMDTRVFRGYHKIDWNGCVEIT